MEKIEKCCLNCAFCVSEYLSLGDPTHCIQALKLAQRKNNFSFLSGVGGMPSKTLKCYLGFWDQKVSSSKQPENKDLATISLIIAMVHWMHGN